MTRNCAVPLFAAVHVTLLAEDEEMESGTIPVRLAVEEGADSGTEKRRGKRERR